MQPAGPTTQLSVALVDDHDLFRAGFRQLLEREGVTVACEGAWHAGTVDDIRRSGARLALVDLPSDGRGDPVEPVRGLIEALPTHRVVVFTRSRRDVDVYLAVRAGVHGYALKSTPIPEVVAGLGAIAASDGEAAYLSPSIAAIVGGFVRTGRIPRWGDSEMSDRELEVLRLMARGLDNNQIAAELSISAKTVKNHISSIFGKLQMSNRVQAAVYAVRTGLA